MVKTNAPDLVPKDLQVSPIKVIAGGKVRVSFKVFNQGRAKASASKTRVRLSQSADAPSTSDPLLAEFNTPELKVNESVTYGGRSDYSIWHSAW